MGMNIEVFSGPGRQPGQIRIGKPSVPTAQMFLCFVGVIPDAINRLRLTIEFSGVLISEAEFDGYLLHRLVCLTQKD
jgi:hypothetical protein